MTRRTTYTILSLLMVAGIALAAGQADRKQDGPEKVKPAPGFSAKVNVRAKAYPKLLAGGAADGVPYGLQVNSVSDKTVALSWLSPEKTDGYYDDFEGHTDFEVNSPGPVGWSYVDGDNRKCYTWQACSFPNMGQKMAFIVMNPSQTTPATDGNPDFKPFSGKKMLVDFAAVDGQNNDYIISPHLSFGRDFKFSFRARSYKVGDNYPMERIRVGYSTRTMRPSDFVYVSEGDYVELPAEWTLVEYTIPKEAKYVTINCVSDDAFMLMVDDIFIGTNSVRPGVAPKRLGAVPALAGFNLYRNGEKVNAAPITEVRYTDTVADYGTYDYAVSAVYADGTESALSPAVKAEVPDTRLLPFEDSFDDWTLHEDKWTVVAEDGNEPKWKIDYYTYGLVDPAASFRWSSITNYDQSLVSRELLTPNREATWLRFNLKLQNEKPINVDYLRVEVSCDSGATWRPVEVYDNTGGAFDWRVCQVNLGKYLTDDLFRIRFRAMGANAFYIDYWYVDDIKVWTPEWTEGDLTVATADGPVAGAEVSLAASHGGECRLATDDSGKAATGQIEKGTYTVTVKAKGCNQYGGTWTVGDGDNHLKVNMTRPVATLSPSALEAELPAESKATKTFTLRNDGDGPMSWTLQKQTAKGSGDDRVQLKECRSWKASGDLQTSVAFDGEHYYTTSSVMLGEFWKYDRQGRLLEHFSIPGMYYKLYDLTYDGRYFYGSDQQNRLFQLDFENRRVAGVINIDELPDLKITHCTYDPDRKAFWVGGMTTIALVRRDGSLVSLLTDFSTTQSVAVFGSAYDNVSPGGPYLWLADETAEDNYSLDCVQLLQYSLTSRKLTGVKHVVKDVPGYVVGNESMGRNYICGLHTTTALSDGRLTLIGVLQQSPSLIFEYSLAETDSWLSYSPKHGTLQPGEEQTVTATLDALRMKSGEAHQATAELLTIPELADRQVTFAVRAGSESATPRPQGLAGAADSAAVSLTWTAGNGAAVPTGYNVYRDGRRVNSAPVTAMSYKDGQLAYGSYIYKVTALYDGDRESALSDSVTVLVKRGAPYYAPVGLAAQVEKNSKVTLSWLSPRSYASVNDTMTWATGVHADQLGFTDGGYFYAACAWEPEDLVRYRNKTISSVGVQLVNPCTYLALLVIKDGKTIYKKPYRGDLLYNGSFTEVPLDRELAIDPGATYYFAFQIMHEAGIMPLSVDDGATLDGKGNLLSVDGKTWYTALNSGISGNFNIRVSLSPNSRDTEQEPSGYRVLRNGQPVTARPVTALSYADEVEAPGTYTYTVASVYADGGESAAGGAARATIVDIGERHAPAAVSARVDINRHVSLRWDYPMAAPSSFPADLATRPVTTKAGCPEMVSSFVGTASEMAVASDGKFIYTSIVSEDGRVNKYSLDGQLVDRFNLEGVEGIRNIAFDGKSFYVADNQTDIKRVDMDKHTVLETADISEYARHLAYIPGLDNGNGGFEVGDWETSILVTKDGSKLATGPALLGAAGTAYHNGRLYALEQGRTDNAYTVGIYDLATNTCTGTISLGDYAELTDIEGASGGGMSVVSTADGLTLLAIALQRANGNTRFVFIDLDGMKGVSGYNIYRNGEKLNGAPLTRRYFEQDITEPGQYDYTVETVYIDDRVSAPSAPERAEIVEPGVAKKPAEVKAVQSACGYNVSVSFADPDRNEGAAVVEDCERMTAGTAASVSGWTNSGGAWTATAGRAYDGQLALTAQAGSEALLYVPVAGASYLKMALSNADDRKGQGALDVLYSTEDDSHANFITLETLKASEGWSEAVVALPAGTRYVALRKPAARPQLFVDDIRLFAAEPVSRVYAYDVYRDGKKVNGSPVTGVSFTDKNLLPGRYTYQARLTTVLSAVSELSDPAEIDLDYDNKSMPPTGVTAALQADNSVQLGWQRPAIGEPVYLRWHDGNCHDAAGLPNGGAYFAAVRWAAADLKAYDKMTVTDVEMFVNQIPDALYVLVYEGNSLVRQQFVPRLEERSYNTVKLAEPLQLNTSKELKVAVYVEHNSATVPLGYDAGPAKSGYGDLYSTDGASWTTLGASDTNIDGNWNISVGLSPYSEQDGETAGQAAPAGMPRLGHRSAAGLRRLASAPLGEPVASQKNVLEGYNIYRNRVKLNDSCVKETQYHDTRAYTGQYLEYQVAAVYSRTGESLSEKVTVVASGIDGTTAGAAWRVVAQGSAIRIIGAHAGDRVSVVSAAGACVATAVIADSYATVIGCAALPAGTYLVKVGGEVAKIIIR